jgi:acetate kinase
VSIVAHPTLLTVTLLGVLMSTRCGDIDPTAIFHDFRVCAVPAICARWKPRCRLVCSWHALTQAHRFQSFFIILLGDEKAQLAYEVFVYSVLKYIGSYFVALGNLDAIVFSGGIGEHSDRVRRDICAGLAAPLGVHLDQEANRRLSTSVISSERSRVPVLVIPTNEELQMARQVINLIM